MKSAAHNASSPIVAPDGFTMPTGRPRPTTIATGGYSAAGYIADSVASAASSRRSTAGSTSRHWRACSYICGSVAIRSAIRSPVTCLSSANSFRLGLPSARYSDSSCSAVGRPPLASYSAKKRLTSSVRISGSVASVAPTASRQQSSRFLGRMDNPVSVPG